MKKKTKWSVAGAIGLAVVIIGVTSAMKGRNKATEVRMEKVQRRDLVASVTASGQVQPHTKVDISADISGRIVQLAVKEGQMVTKGQFLLEIDPSQYRANVERATAAVASARSQAAQAKPALSQAQRNFDRLMALKKANPTLVSDEQIEQLRTQVEVAQAQLESANHAIDQATAAYKLLAGPKRLYLGDIGHFPAKNPAAEAPTYLTEVVGWFNQYLAGGPKLVGGGVELAHDPWDGRTSLYKSIPRTRSRRDSDPQRDQAPQHARGELDRAPHRDPLAPRGRAARAPG